MDVSIALKLVLAAVMGGVIGIEREIRDKPAGLRTNMLICIGATQFMAISSKAAEILGGDPTRIAAQIITGVGFLGAGAVLQTHGFITGLTTAATIWVVAGVGMALGAGLYGIAVLATVLTIGTLYFFSLVENRVQGVRHLDYNITVSELDGGLHAVHRLLHDLHVPPINLGFQKNDGGHRVWFQTKTTKGVNDSILQSLSKEPLITAVETSTRPEDALPLRRNRRNND